MAMPFCTPHLAHHSKGRGWCRVLGARPLSMAPAEQEQSLSLTPLATPPVPSRQAARACQGPSPSTPRAPSRPPGRPGFGATAALRERGATHPAQPPVPHTAERRQRACAPRLRNPNVPGLPAGAVPPKYTHQPAPQRHSRTRRARAARPPTAPPAPKTHAAAPAADAARAARNHSSPPVLHAHPPGEENRREKREEERRKREKRERAMMHTVPEWDLECYTFAQHSGASV
jgi:hypothetical protein